MRQVLQSSEATVVRDVPPPSCRTGGVLVRNHFSVVSSGTERSVLESAQQSLLGHLRARPELAAKAVSRVRQEGFRQTRELIKATTISDEYPVGNSCAGTVIEVGARVRGIAVGDRVACAGAGYANHAEIVSIPSNLCAIVPPSVSLEAAAITTIASIALHGVRIADVRVGDRVAVVGCGLLGQITSRLLQAAGATVIALDIDPDRITAAIASGADYGFRTPGNETNQVLAVTDGMGVDQVVVTAAAETNGPLLLATEIVRDRGTVVLVGVAPIDLPRAPLFEKELLFRVSRSYGPGRYDPDYEEKGLDYPPGYVRWTEQRNMRCVLDLQKQHKLHLQDLIDDVLPIEEASEAYARLTGPALTRPRGALAFSYSVAEAPATPESGQRDDSSGTHAVPRDDGPVRLGLVGPGTFAREMLVPAFSSAGALLVAVSGGSGPSAGEAARKGGFDRVAESSASLFADPAIDAVVIATRHDAHAMLVCEALAAGKHVFCEKPLALDQTELEEVLAAEADSTGILSVGFNRRFAPHVRQVQHFLADATGPLAATYRVCAGILPPKHWVQDLEQGGGRIIGEVCHFIDTLSFVADSPVVQVHVDGFAGAQLPSQATDNVALMLRFANDSIATITYVASGATGMAKERVEVFSETRSAILDDYKVLYLFRDARRERNRLRSQDKGHSEEARTFLHGVNTGQSPIPLASIANVHRACFAAVRSLQTGSPVSVDL